MLISLGIYAFYSENIGPKYLAKFVPGGKSCSYATGITNDLYAQRKSLSAYTWYGLGFGAGGFQVRNPIPMKIHLLHVKSYVVAKCPPVGVAWKFGEGVPAQKSSSSSDCGSKLRGPSQNSPRVASKRDVNITKLNCAYTTQINVRNPS
ncbi:hypothetical protein AVEN_257547-1 [Araneus ventricosus]|uniref:Uncharacterized protein n=1 Tax=Araneus ventricosus TaxID=182803 RepID=A0A4Y2L4E2_ARAVE|nr:hypothetical protein AVEN_257547-1 [Araneus ventricosus]